MLEYILLLIFLAGFATIILEEILRMNKAKSALFFGTLCWVLLFVVASIHGHAHEMEEQFDENVLEIAMLWLFLISAMTFVAYLDKKGIIENTVYKYLPQKISHKKLLLIMGLFTFLFSSVADNLTATLVALTILLALKIETEKVLRYAVVIVFAANAGGVALITGDVTTLMIFLGGKVAMSHLLWLFIPALISLTLIYFFISRSLTGSIEIIKKKDMRIHSIDIAIGAVFFLTIISILLGHLLFHIPPVLIFLFGLSIMFLTSWIHKMKNNEDLRILDYIKSAEFDALFFFLGVLLLVGSLKEVGILDKISYLYDYMPAYVANYFIGLASAVVDNIPLTAIMLKSNLPLSEASWLSLTYAVGVGGSLFSIGSAAGVVAMSKIKELSFTRYLRFSFVILIAYTFGYICAHFLSLFVTGSL
ncbi:sodium:proton antiporter NhaD [Candidatus Woesearchaeota archaeon]|nr:sodium:proton antiporter NhaD [Nanoarchaeota archaeon]MCB9370881.1 sodium:proton antiporter NhaD [Candidatus Woesearchaeota archaeon]USN43982.1 MAG: sodium:proton antiporter NhaD [Candidatus Woesearchaeota archaeon]